MMKSKLIACLVVSSLSALSLGCSPSGGPGGPGDAGGSSGGQAPPASAADHYVSTEDGAYANPGTEAAPFKTISQALDVAQHGDVIQVLPGLYSAESFPLIVPAGVTLLGDAKGYGNGVKIVGGGFEPGGSEEWTAAVILRTESRIEGVTITNPDIAGSYQIGLVMDDAAEVERCTVEGSERGIDPMDHTMHQVIRGNIVRNHSGSGIMFGHGGHHALVEGNTITANAWGVWVKNASPDLGGGERSAGNNRIGRNDSHDLLVEGSSSNVSAQNNYWDHQYNELETPQAPEADEDIKIRNGGQADYAHAKVWPEVNIGLL